MAIIHSSLKQYPAELLTSETRGLWWLWQCCVAVLVLVVWRNIAAQERSLQVHDSPGHTVAELLDDQEIISRDEHTLLSNRGLALIDTNLAKLTI